MNNAIIIGASTGLGKELAKVFAKEGWGLGLAARKLDLLEDIRRETKSKNMFIRPMDIRHPEAARFILNELIQDLGGVQLIYINTGINHLSEAWEDESDIIKTNVEGVISLVNAAYDYFKSAPKSMGKIVVTTSIAGLRGGSPSPAYSGSKAFLTNYLEGLSKKIYQKNENIQVTEIRAGFIKTKMIEGQKGMFWAQDPKKVAIQIYAACLQKRRVVYVTKRFWLIGQILKFLPYSVYRNIGTSSKT